jgi:putative colanic acid biosysnthesis UDP-glucose lipid carrier transferase
MRRFSLQASHGSEVVGSTRALTWVRTGAGKQPAITLLKEYLKPAVVALILPVVVLSYGQRFTGAYGILLVVAFASSLWLLSQPRFEHVVGTARWRDLRDAIVEWGYVVALLLLLGFIFKVSGQFSRKVIGTWFVSVPIVIAGMQAAAHRITKWRLRVGSINRRLVIVGANHVGLELAARLQAEPWLGTLDGYFDDRQAGRLPRACRGQLLGRCMDLPEYSRRNLVHAIYICLPISAQPRFRVLLDQLRDSTASIYFVPDLSAFDLMQARIGEIRGMPLIAIRDTPFCGMTGVQKRVSDVVLSCVALALVAPLMIGIAIAVHRSSPGPILFRQRRYGLDGRQFVVYKFRTMTVWEDERKIRQARRNDPRVTAIGRMLRRTSFDELPQLFNVLAGSMSLVGPRPHAVAHNEHYRKLVNGYMLRHKVRPGITGLAQVNGLRGETRDSQLMRERVQLDLHYVKNWSLGLDLRILLKTVLLFLRDRRAY